jgi:hypothetical protein
MASPLRRKDVCALWKALHQEASVSELARVFQANPTAVQRTLFRRLEHLVIHGRDAPLDDESEAGITASALESFQPGKFLTRKQLLNMGYKDYNPCLTKG